MTKPLAYWNGTIVAQGDVRVPVESPTVKYGAAVFEGIRAYWNEERGNLFLFRLQEHLDRLRMSMLVMGIDDPFREGEVREAVLAMLRANDYRGPVHIRLMVYLDGDGELGARGPCGLAVLGVMRASAANVETGLHCQVSSWRRISDQSMPPRVKTIGNYVNSRLALMQAKADGYDSAILMNDRGCVSEGPTSCIFLVRDGVLVTPSTTSSVLESITRDTLLRIAESCTGSPAVVRDVDRSELYAAEEVFMCGSGPEIVPVNSVDRRNVGAGKPGPVTRKIQERYFRIVQGRDPAREPWLTPVYA